MKPTQPSVWTELQREWTLKGHPKIAKHSQIATIPHEPRSSTKHSLSDLLPANPLDEVKPQCYPPCLSSSGGLESLSFEQTKNAVLSYLKQGEKKYSYTLPYLCVGCEPAFSNFEVLLNSMERRTAQGIERKRDMTRCFSWDVDLDEKLAETLRAHQDAKLLLEEILADEGESLRHAVKDLQAEEWMNVC